MCVGGGGGAIGGGANIIVCVCVCGSWRGKPGKSCIDAICFVHRAHYGRHTRGW